MNPNLHWNSFPIRNRTRLTASLLLSAFVLARLAAPPIAPAATVWNGPPITFTKPDSTDPTQPTNQDRITPNIWLTRGTIQGIYNIKTETGYTHFLSPAGTEWASGTTSNYATLTYTNWEGWAKSLGGPPQVPGHNAVVHLVAEDIYIDLTFSSWPLHGGGFSYARSTAPASNLPPSVSITNPVDGASFPASTPVTINASASDPDGSVTSVEFFDGATSLGVDTTAPYSVNGSFYPGSHSLTAVATDNLGLSATSAVISLTITSTPIANPIVGRIPKGDVTVELKTVADGMVSPLGMAVPDDGSGRMFVYDQAGFVWLVTAAGWAPTPMLDLRTRLVNLDGSYDERGLLGLAAHTNFAQYPYLYTYTSEFTSGPADFPCILQLGGTNDHQSVIAEWRMDASNTNGVDLSTRREIIRIDEPQSNNNAGTIRFGPDGLLYVTLGDGGQANDVGNGHADGGNAQNLGRILGKVIRIDVAGTNSATGKYGIPASNPFAVGGGLPEIYAYGLRNPSAFSFDRATGQIYLADVGQNTVEEVDNISAGGNYGWNLREGAFWFDPATGNVVTAPVRPPPASLIDPIAQYGRDDGSAVIGGFAYHGSAIPALINRYVFGDWGMSGSLGAPPIPSGPAPSGRLFYLDSGTNINELRIGLDDRALGRFLKAFGEDTAGELYLFASKSPGPTGRGGIMMKLVPPPPSPLTIASVTATNGTNFQTVCTGGIGPLVQTRKTFLNEPVWLTENVTSGKSATAAVVGTSGFFRVVDSAHQSALPFTVTLNSAMERPTNSMTGSGSGILSLEGNTLCFSISYRGLSGPATLAHIHGPANTTASADVIIDLRPFNGGAFDTNGTLSGTILLTDTEKAMLLAGLTYVNIHTSAYPGGEIRGQIAPVLRQASLLGASESIPVNTPATGLGTFMLVGTQLTYTVTFSGLSGPATAGHIHGPAPVGQDAAPLIAFSVPNATSGTVSGGVALNPTGLAAILDGQAYANFHTAANPGGEIRGQIEAQTTAVPLTAWISGLNENPPLTNTAAGLGLFSLDGDSLAFNITYSGLSGTATAAHLHGPAVSSTNASAQIDLAPFSGGAFGTNGGFSGVVQLSQAQRIMILSGQAYFNIHTAANPGGEARGQLAPVLMSAAADGPAEHPAAIISTGTALGLFALVGNTLDLNVTYLTLSGTVSASHIHAPATAADTAGVVLDLAPYNGGAYGVSGSLTGTATLTPSLLGNLIDGLSYINFHTAANPGGEIRGQILR